MFAFSIGLALLVGSMRIIERCPWSRALSAKTLRAAARARRLHGGLGAKLGDRVHFVLHEISHSSLRFGGSTKPTMRSLETAGFARL